MTSGYGRSVELPIKLMSSGHLTATAGDRGETRGVSPGLRRFGALAAPGLISRSKPAEKNRCRASTAAEVGPQTGLTAAAYSCVLGTPSCLTHPLLRCLETGTRAGDGAQIAPFDSPVLPYEEGESRAKTPAAATYYDSL